MLVNIHHHDLVWTDLEASLLATVEADSVADALAEYASRPDALCNGLYRTAFTGADIRERFADAGHTLAPGQLLEVELYYRDGSDCDTSWPNDSLCGIPVGAEPNGFAKVGYRAERVWGNR